MVDRGMEDKIRRRGGGILLCMVKGQRVSESTLAFSASHEARRRMAVFAVQLAGICTRPASREARCRAAVKPRPSCMSPYAPARTTRRDGCRALALLVVAVRAAEEVAGGDGEGEAELEKGARYAGRLD